jgi:transmembrane sensor
MNVTHDAIREEAAAWFAKRRDGACSAEASFEAWRARSDVHAQAYAETERAWEQWKQLQNSVRMREMTAAAMKATAPGRRQATGRRWRPLLVAASLAAIAVFGAIRLLPLVMHAPLVTYSTGVGEQRTEQLPDGTRIVLNTQTAMQVRYDRHRREVTLKHGEALFDVVHDAKRPFVVTTADGSVTDLGTQFLVRDEDGTTLVTLLHGRVEVATKAASKQLVPGEQAHYGASVAGVRVREVDTTTATSWMHGRLDFSDWPLAKVVAEANRYSMVKLHLDDTQLADLHVGGSLRTGNNADIADALSAALSLRVAHRDANEIVLMSR